MRTGLVATLQLTVQASLLLDLLTVQQARAGHSSGHAHQPDRCGGGMQCSAVPAGSSPDQLKVAFQPYKKLSTLQHILTVRKMGSSKYNPRKNSGWVRTNW